MYGKCKFVRISGCIVAVLEIAAGHWLFSDQFQHLANQNPFLLAKLTAHSQWDRNQ